MAARLLDSNGNLKPFEQWKAEVLPIASHQCGPWLETEYNTAVLRARQTAQWQQFLDEKDVLPNLKWLPSTSPNPGADHRLYWNTILPIGHPFWDQHCPGDRWNCKCSLTSTDEPPTPVPSEEEPPFPAIYRRDTPLIPVWPAPPPRPVPSSPKTTPISQRTATTAPSTNPTSSPDSTPSSKHKSKTATTVRI